MRAILLASLLWVGTTLDTTACTVFKITHEGRTIVGNNEDAWSINAQVRFEQGRDGGYGAVYFGHFNGHPLRHMVDQLGMNEAGLVFDGLSIQPKSVPPVNGRRQIQFDQLMPMVMRACADVHEAAALLRTTDNSWLTQSMLFLVDRNGDYLIVEADTLILGNDATYAVGNWRMSTCTDPDAIPIPRLQAGRALLTDSSAASIAHGTDVLERMKACRSKMGEGTIFSVLFDTQLLQANLYFYHDFSEVVAFNLKEELANGDRTVDMASLFGARPEYERLQNHITPFHQRWLFWVLVVFAAALTVWIIIGGVVLLARGIQRIRERSTRPILPLLLSLLFCVVAVPLIAVLLTQESVYYFGLGDVAELLAWAPLALIFLALSLAWSRRSIAGRGLAVGATVLLPFFALLGYWSMILP